MVVPLKTQASLAVGRIASEYEFRTDLGEDMRQTRRVDWIRTDIPRAQVDQDLLYSFGSFMTVCQVTRNNAEARIQAMVEEKPPPPRPEEPEEPSNIELLARDQVLAYIREKFTGHDMARLVEGVLQAQGYFTRCSPPGPDGGVDILAGSGSIGFDNPRLCVQVKATAGPVDVGVFRQLKGTMDSFKAEQGLLVSWGGFKQSVYSEAKTDFFRVRLWDAGDLLNAILRYYEQLPEALRAELPLKRVWALALEEEQG